MSSFGRISFWLSLEIPTLLSCTLNPVVMFESQSWPFSPIELGAILCPEALPCQGASWGAGPLEWESLGHQPFLAQVMTVMSLTIMVTSAVTLHEVYAFAALRPVYRGESANDLLPSQCPHPCHCCLHAPHTPLLGGLGQAMS